MLVCGCVSCCLCVATTATLCCRRPRRPAAVAAAPSRGRTDFLADQCCEAFSACAGVRERCGSQCCSRCCGGSCCCRRRLCATAACGCTIAQAELRMLVGTGRANPHASGSNDTVRLTAAAGKITAPVATAWRACAKGAYHLHNCIFCRKTGNTAFRAATRPSCAAHVQAAACGAAATTLNWAHAVGLHFHRWCGYGKPRFLFSDISSACG